MPSTTRGSILISTANDIGEALVEKLGGVGYSPNEWKDKFNLCGIAPVDSAPALSVLSNSAGTGDERGSILIATADAIGAILNKKYNVLRGFKPKEWASACRKMKALEEGSVASASIASFSDGADTVPLTSCVCSIDANLDGKTAVNAVHTRKNLVNSSLNEQGSINATTGANVNSDKRIRTTYIKINANTTYSISIGGSVNLFELYQYKTDGTLARAYIAINAQTYTFTSHADAVSIRFSMRYADNSVIQTSAIENLQLEQSSEPTTYEEYSAETKTADLGRAVYGGSADIIKGEGVNEYEILTLAVADMNNSENYPGWRNCGVREIIGAEVSSSVTNGVSTVGQYWSYNTLGSNDILYLPRGQYNNMTQSDWINTYPDLVIQFVIQKATPENFTFEPVKIDSFPGVNNIWNDCGNTAVEYYKAPTPYTRKTATGGIANFSDQRTDLPLTKAIANIAPSIAGKSAVNLYQGKKNLVDGTDFTRGLPSTTIGASIDTITASTRYAYYGIGNGGGNFTVSSVSSDTDYFNTILIYGYTKGVLSVYTNASVNTSKTVDFSSCDYIRLAIGTRSTNYQVPTDLTGYGTIQLEVGSTASAFEPYQDPTTYTAELGETVYGGSVDFVSGEVKKSSILIDLATMVAASAWNMGAADRFRARLTQYQTSSGWSGNWQNTVSNVFVCENPTTPFVNRSDYSFANIPQNYYNFDIKVPSGQFESVAEFAAWLANTDGNGKHALIVIDMAEDVSSSIPGRVISPIEGVNNYWNDAGGDTEIEYFEEESEG